MPEWWVGDATGTRRKVVDPWIGDATGVRRQISKAWVGDATGVPRLYYQRTAPMALTASPASSSAVNLSWTAVPGATYTLTRGGTTVYSGTGTSKQDTGLVASTTYTWTVVAVVGGSEAGRATASAKTNAQATQQKTITLEAVSSASYNGSGTNRGIDACYFGWYSSTHSTQRSQFRINVPADLRNCVSVDKVEVSIMGRHTLPNGGTTVSLVVHHNPSLGGNYGGSTATVTDRNIGKPGYFGGAEWVDVTNAVSSGRYSVKEEFRVHGAQGFGLMSPGGSSSQSYYGYADGIGGPNVPRVRFHYTVRVA